MRFCRVGNFHRLWSLVGVGGRCHDVHGFELVFTQYVPWLLLQMTVCRRRGARCCYFRDSQGGR